MSMLTHGLEQPLRAAPWRPRLSRVRKRQLTRVALQGLTVLSMGSVLTALIALRTAIYVWHLPA